MTSTDTDEQEIEFLWIDFESDGTDPSLCHIIEAGVIATGADLENEFFTIDTMIVDGDVNEAIANIEANPVLKPMHGDNGLLADLYRVRDGEVNAMTIQEFDQHLYNLVKTYNRSNKKLIISGSGVAHYDHPVVKAKMPHTASLFQFFARDIGHTRREFLYANGYDLIDVNANKNHRAFADITDHLNETKAFRDFFRKAVLAIAITGTE